MDNSKTKNKYTLFPLFNNPAKIYLVWSVLLGLFCFIGIPILSIGSSGGEQKPLTLLADALDIAVYGFFVISILTSILFSGWFKKYWYVNMLVMLITGFIIISVNFLNK